MGRSQLEMYVEILEVLYHRCPLKLTRIKNKINVNCSMLKMYLDFLIKQGLVEQKIDEDEGKVYAITQLGVTVLKEFSKLK